MKAGTRIEVRGWTMNGATTWESAVILRWTKRNGPKDNLPSGYHPVQFADGGSLMVHESRMRVVGDRA